MNMPTKAIAALVNIKASLLSAEQPESVIITDGCKTKGKSGPAPKVCMRHAKRPNAYQRMMQRGDKW